MLESERGLGPRWSLKELRSFYILLKAHGRQWDRLQERLPQRTDAMVRALFDMHRGYLALPEASVEGFCTIMRDHYASLDERQQQSQQQTVKTEGSGLPRKREAEESGVSAMEEDAMKPEPAKSDSNHKKKRRLAKLLGCDQLEQLRIRSESDTDMLAPVQVVEKRQTRPGKKSALPRRSRVYLQGVDSEARAGVAMLQDTKFDLPWYHWFYSYVDVDFFRHNEFLDCLDRMGLGKITVAARPIWSSVRASMGRPRRLSPLFFAQEKLKLETYRSVKRQLDPRQQDQRCFQLGVLVSFSGSDGACHVVLNSNTMRETTVACSLDNVMVLDALWSGKAEVGGGAHDMAATTLLRRGIGASSAVASLTELKPLDPVADQYRDEKLRAVLAVKSLLHRKEQIVLALGSLNERVAEQQLQLHEQNGMTSSLWTTPTAFSSAAVQQLAWANSRDKVMVQQQHAWLAVNLDVTNSYLKAALLHLQSFSATNQIGASAAAHSDTGYPSDAFSWANETPQAPTETLTVEQMRWAIAFLSSSQQKAASVVAESALQVAGDEMRPATLGDSANNSDRRTVVSPETMQLVANCVTLTSVLDRQGGAAPKVPPMLTQKLVERVLELLKPRHEANLDLYAELRTAAEAAQLQLALQPRGM
ncbi:hypothetical protein BBJ28_00024643 [Nothophytophthora sp. Chile5]|nr:hypothetical protein BBJ28_00024643 [Nothophytophthora sp. Chile5]